MKSAWLPKLEQFLKSSGLIRLHPESVEPTARAAVEAMAGLPHYDEIWAGDLHTTLQIVAIASGERIPGVEFARRAQLLRERAVSMSARVRGEVQALQLAVYERPVSPEERDFVVEKARFTPRWPLAIGRVATWVVALAEPALYAGPFRGWPEELSADQIRALLG